MTSDVCDLCWGSGKENDKWPSLRERQEKLDELFRHRQRLEIDPSGGDIVDAHEETIRMLRHQVFEIEKERKQLMEDRMRVRHMDEYFEGNWSAMDSYIKWLRENPYPEEGDCQNFKCSTSGCKTEAATSAIDPNEEQLRLNKWIETDDGWICPKCSTKGD